MPMESTFTTFCIAIGSAGLGVLGTVARTWGDRRIGSKDKEADRVAEREALEDKSRDSFRDELHKHVEELYKRSEKCEDDRRRDHEECQRNREKDLQRVADLEKDAANLRGMLSALGGLPNARAEGRQRSKTKAR